MIFISCKYNQISQICYCECLKTQPTPKFINMILNKPLFERLVDEALQQKFSGWDFAYVANRMVESQPSWNYRQIVGERIKDANSLLDLDTGGGELLSSLQPLPPVTYATEGFPPNVPIARRCLEPLGIKVFDTIAHVPLPFEENFFDLVLNRHGSYLPSELYRILKPGKSFITQQVGGRNCIRFNEVLGDEVGYTYADWTLERAIRELEESGFTIVDKREEYPLVEFRDIGAIVFFLKVISWQVSDFTVEKYYEKLGAIHNEIQETGRFVATEHRFYLEVQKT